MPCCAYELSIYLLPTTFIHFKVIKVVGNKYILNSEFIAVNYLVAVVTVEHKQSKPTV
jgi:hypothetical protein